jgi:hypothetical protein
MLCSLHDVFYPEIFEKVAIRVFENLQLCMVVEET